MNLIELKQAVDNAVESAKEYGADPIDILVSLQIEGPGVCRVRSDYICSDKDLELHYDNDGIASGCVLLGQLY